MNRTLVNVIFAICTGLLLAAMVATTSSADVHDAETPNAATEVIESVDTSIVVGDEAVEASWQCCVGDCFDDWSACMDDCFAEHAGDQSALASCRAGCTADRQQCSWNCGPPPV